MKNIFKYNLLLLLLFLYTFIGNGQSIPLDRTLQSRNSKKQLEEITNTTIEYSHSEDDAPSASSSEHVNYEEEFNNFYNELALKEEKKGIEYYNEHKWKKAIIYFKKAAKFNPALNSIKTNLNNANNQLKQKKAYKRIAIQNKKPDKKFVKNLNLDIKIYAAQINRLRKNLRGIVPQLPDKKKIIKGGVILGLLNTPTKNSIYEDYLMHPLTGEPIMDDECFATSNSLFLPKEIVRGALDNLFMGAYTLNSEYGKKLINELNGVHFENLMAHSNGATVTEALIREKIITVDELNVIGGDRSLINYSGYNDLINNYKVKKIVVWINSDDIIPGGSTAWWLINQPENVRSRYQADLDAFINSKLIGVGKVNPNIVYHILKGPEYNNCGMDLMDSHSLKCYFRNIKIYNEKRNKVPSL